MSELNTEYLNQITEQINNINNYIDKAAAGLENESQEEIDKKIEKLSLYLEEKLLAIRQKIINFFKAQYKSALDHIALLEPIVNITLTDPSQLISWGNNLINYLKGPYVKMVELQAEILLAVVDLSNALITVSSHSFNNPKIPAINVNIPPITASDITG